MKNTFKYLFGTLALAGAMVACSPEEFPGMNEAGIPEANAYASAVKVTVDQSTNQVCLSLDAPAVYPVWNITLPSGKTEISTNNRFERIFVNAGDYTVTMQVGNRDGISDGSYTTTFHIDNTIIDFGKYVTMLSKADWHMANKEPAHLACGESGTDGTNWWKAGENEKAKEGVYDNQLTFADDYSYHFEPGDHGTIYVNKGVTIWPDLRDPEADFNVPVEAQDATYGFDVDGDDLYITFPKGTYFPYIANDYIWNNPKYKVVNLTTKKMTLLIDEPGVIAWQYILTTENTVEKAFTGFTYDQPDNIWKNAEVEAGGIYYADAGWTPYPNNGGATFEVTNQEVKAVLPIATAAQWQAQFPIITNIGPGSEYMTSSKSYDFSCVISSNKNLKAMTLKLVETGENNKPGSLGIAYDANAVFYDNSTNLNAFEDYVFYLVDQKGVDIQDNLLQLILDFGGCEEGTEVTVKNIVLIEHDKNTELGLLPGNSEGGGDTPGDKPSVSWTGENLLANMNVNLTQYFAPGWAQLPDAPYTAENGVYTIEYSAATSERWQAQFTFNNTGISLDPEKTYDFRCKLVSNLDHPGVTVKLTQQDDDNTFLTEDMHALVAYEEYWVELVDLKFIVNANGKGVISDLKMPFDFGGNAEGASFTISDLHLQEHVAGSGAGSGSALAYDDADNLWKAVDEGPAFISVTPWFANGGWAQVADPVWSHEGNVWELDIVHESAAQWQAQFPINTTLHPTLADSYDMSVTLEADNDIKGVTVKFTETDEGETKHDKNFFSDDQHDVTAFEPLVVEYYGLKLKENDAHALSLFVDFGGCTPNTHVKISNIIFRKSK